MNLETSRKLFSTYSPLKTNDELYNRYISITNIKNIEKKHIRSKYNKEICNHFINEAVIKAAFIKKFSINKSPKNTVTIFELNVADSRADICMINGKSMVFEIKTEFDTFNRLENQLRDYTKTFQYISIVVPESNLTNVKKYLLDFVGLITYKQNKNKSINFCVYKEPTLNTNISSQYQLESLSKSQLKNKFPEQYAINKDKFILNIINAFSKKEITETYNYCVKAKYRDRWEYLQTVYKDIYPLDYQWFFKNNVNPKIVYK